MLNINVNVKINVFYLQFGEMFEVTASFRRMWWHYFRSGFVWPIQLLRHNVMHLNLLLVLCSKGGRGAALSLEQPCKDD